MHTQGYYWDLNSGLLESTPKAWVNSTNTPLLEIQIELRGFKLVINGIWRIKHACVCVLFLSYIWSFVIYLYKRGQFSTIDFWKEMAFHQLLSQLNINVKRRVNAIRLVAYTSWSRLNLIFLAFF